jgi:hypothetical protein
LAVELLIRIELMKECSVRGVAPNSKGLKIFSVANRFPPQLLTHFIAVKTAGEESS